MNGLFLEDFRQALKRPVPPLLIDVREEHAYAADTPEENAAGKETDQVAKAKGAQQQEYGSGQD